MRPRGYVVQTSWPSTTMTSHPTTRRISTCANSNSEAKPKPPDPKPDPEPDPNRARAEAENKTVSVVVDVPALYHNVPINTLPAILAYRANCGTSSNMQEKENCVIVRFLRTDDTPARQSPRTDFPRCRGNVAMSLSATCTSEDVDLSTISGGFPYYAMNFALVSNADPVARSCIRLYQ